MLEQLYQLRPSDEQSRLLDPFIRTQSDSGLDVNQASIISVPSNHVLIARSICGSFTPGAGQSVSLARIFVLPPLGIQVQIAAREITTAIANPDSALVNWSGEIWLPPGFQIRAQGTFSAAAAANSTRLDVVGMMIPIGNVERV